jgi:transposase InsO family protein
LQAWAKSSGIEWQFKHPGCQAHASQFESLDQTRAISEQWIPVYNEQRTHSAIGHLPPMVFKQQRQRPESLLSIGID